MTLCKVFSHETDTLQKRLSPINSVGNSAFDKPSELQKWRIFSRFSTLFPTKRTIIKKLFVILHSLLPHYYTLMHIIMVSVAIKNRTRDEIIAAFRESIRKKQEWQQRAEEEIKKIRQERLQLSI